MDWKRLTQNSLGRWAVAFLFWSVIVLFYSTASGRMGQRTTWSMSFRFAAAQWYVWALLAPLIIRFDRLLGTRPEALGRRILCHIPASFAFTAVYIYASACARGLLGAGGEQFSFSLAPLALAWRGMFHWNVLVYWVIVGAYIACDYYGNFRERQFRTAELERLLAESRLEALRAQLHPHFLFNALNAISAHVERETRTARRMLEQLGDLLRLTLDHCEDQEIPLERELAFLDRYLAIQKVRFEDRLETRMDIASETLDALLPTFLLQPMVENAIQHGISRRSSKGSIGVAAWRDRQRLRLRVWDDGPGLPPGWDPEVTQGLGISNTRERLRRLYGDAGHSFDLANEPGGGVSVNISLPFRRAQNANGDRTNGSGG